MSVINAAVAVPRYDHLVDSTGRCHTLAEIDRRLVAGEDNKGRSQLAIDNWIFLRRHDTDGMVKYGVSAESLPGSSRALDCNSLVDAYRDVKVPSQVPPAQDAKKSAERIVLLRAIALRLAREFIGSTNYINLSDEQLREVDQEFAACSKRHATPDHVCFDPQTDSDLVELYPYPTISFTWFSGCGVYDHDDVVEFDVMENDDNDTEIVPRDPDQAELLDKIDNGEPPAKRAKVVPAPRLVNVELNPGPSNLQPTVCALMPVASYLLSHLGKSLPIISVGSGMGIEEQYLVDHGYTVVCIDPAKRTRDRYTDRVLVRKPDFACVRQYLDACSSYDGQVQLLLHYPLPDYVLYDIQAIHDLRPKIVVVMATNGASSGSMLLHAWLRQCGVPTLGKIATEQSWSDQFGDFSALTAPVRYQRLKFEMLPVMWHNDLQVNSAGVEQTRFVASLMRVGPYSSPTSIRSPTHEERIEDGPAALKKRVSACVCYLQSLRVDEDDEDKAKDEDSDDDRQPVVTTFTSLRAHSVPAINTVDYYSVRRFEREYPTLFRPGAPRQTMQFSADAAVQMNAFNAIFSHPLHGAEFKRVIEGTRRISDEYYAQHPEEAARGGDHAAQPPAPRLVNVELNPGPGRQPTVCSLGGGGWDGMFTHVPGLTLSTLRRAQEALASTDLVTRLVHDGPGDGMREMLFEVANVMASPVADRPMMTMLKGVPLTVSGRRGVFTVMHWTATNEWYAVDAPGTYIGQARLALLGKRKGGGIEQMLQAGAQ